MAKRVLRYMRYRFDWRVPENSVEHLTIAYAMTGKSATEFKAIMLNLLELHQKVYACQKSGEYEKEELREMAWDCRHQLEGQILALNRKFGLDEPVERLALVNFSEKKEVGKKDLGSKLFGDL